MSPHTSTSRSGSRYGSGRRSAAFTTEKIAVLAAIPRASVRIAVIAKAGVLRNARAAKARSRISVFIDQPLDAPGRERSVVTRDYSTYVSASRILRVRLRGRSNDFAIGNQE